MQVYFIRLLLPFFRFVASYFSRIKIFSTNTFFVWKCHFLVFNCFNTTLNQYYTKCNNKENFKVVRTRHFFAYLTTNLTFLIGIQPNNMYRPCPHYVSLPPIKLFLFSFQWYVTRKYPIILYDKIIVSMKYLFNFKRLLWPCFRPETTIYNNIVHSTRFNMSILAPSPYQCNIEFFYNPTLRVVALVL